MPKNTTKTNQIAKAYNPKDVEEKWYQYWERHNLFHAEVNPSKKPYTIVIPPPNITGSLTMGHVLNNTIQDLLIRWKRMQGYEALWLPGTDHAGIATQNVVEKALAKEGLSRQKLGREKFLKRVWKWKEEYGGTIIKQLRKLGASCDWSRERFTMDEGLSNAVKEVFVRLYEKGLIYKGKYIVNWCPKDHTAISDDEVEMSQTNGHLGYIKYPIEGTKEFAVAATTRPETILGDTAIAVNPKDKRYKHLIGKTAILPLVGRKLPIIEDDFVDPSFGTGMVKVTPAHDPHDFEIGKRHNLEQVCVMDTSGKMNENAPKPYQGLDRFECRKQIVKDLEAQGLLLKTEPYTYNLGRCYRCETIIEPYLSDQWFVKMKPLAEPALKVVQGGKIKFYPERWVKVYEQWMTNIRDWCISRQLWWGHRIPVYYCDDCGKMMVMRESPKKCLKCSSSKIRQDEDVLDTWFSSWLWPFSTLGWSQDTKDLQYFYPTNTLVTAPDIIFFWVARMIMAGMEFVKGYQKVDGTPRSNDENIIPFRDVYLTSLIRDAQGRKLSKSLGNSPDPLDVISEYGADAVRFTIVYLAPLGQDVRYDDEACKIGRNFANKIWNAGRFLLMNKEQLLTHISTLSLETGKLTTDNLDLSERWIHSRFHSTVKSLNQTLEKYEINNAAKTIYDFVWHDFCDWYVELIKDRLDPSVPSETRQVVLTRAIELFEDTLKLLHPFMPFITEELWQNLRERKEGKSIMIERLTKVNQSFIDPQAEKEMEFVQEVITAVRTIRSEMNIPPSKTCDVVINCPENGKAEILKRDKSYFERLARVGQIQIGTNLRKPPASASAIVDGQEIFVPLEGLIDIEVEKKRLEKEIVRVETMLKGIDIKLNKKDFVERAPREVVEKEKKRLENFKQTLEKLKTNYQSLMN